MLPLSRPNHQIKEIYDVVVVGSGYGGGIAASRMARAGKKVCLLERGKEFLPGDFPDTHPPRRCRRFRRIQQSAARGDAPISSTSISTRT